MQYFTITNSFTPRMFFAAQTAISLIWSSDIPEGQIDELLILYLEGFTCIFCFDAFMTK